MPSTNAKILALVAAIGCGSTQGRPAPGSDEIVLAGAPGWPARTAVRSVPAAFRTSVTSVEVDPAGRRGLLRDTWSDSSHLLGTPVLERYPHNGHEEKRLKRA